MWPEKERISFGVMYAERLGAVDAERDQIVTNVDTMVERDYCDNL